MSFGVSASKQDNPKVIAPVTWFLRVTVGFSTVTKRSAEAERSRSR
jgi:hypothetical protein